MTLSCIIIEDEPLAIEKLEGFIDKTSWLKLLGSFSNSLDGLQFIQNNKTDLVFLDIEMEHLNGLQLLECLQQKPYIIITTAYAEYALKGYELSVFDYLLKPFGYDRFIKAVNKVNDDKSKKQEQNADELSHIFVKSEYRIENVCISDILYIEGMKEYLRIVLLDKKIMTKTGFKELLGQLPDNRFVQVHKSWVIQISKIDSIERNRIKISDKLIPIGNTYKNAFYDKIKLGW